MISLLTKQPFMRQIIYHLSSEALIYNSPDNGDQFKGMFIIVGVGPADPLSMYNDECQIIGSIYEQPKLLEANEQMRDLLKQYLFL